MVGLRVSFYCKYKRIDVVYIYWYIYVGIFIYFILSFWSPYAWFLILIVKMKNIKCNLLCEMNSENGNHRRPASYSLSRVSGTISTSVYELLASNK